MKPIEKEKAFHIFSTSFMILIADQLFKFLTITTIPFKFSIQIIPKILYLTHIRNYGAAFGLFQNMSGLLMWFSIIIIGLILYLYEYIPNKSLFQILVGLILGGTLGNLIDRIRFGYVIDFIDFQIWPAFNVADAAVTIGVVGLIICLMKKS